MQDISEYRSFGKLHSRQCLKQWLAILRSDTSKINTSKSQINDTNKTRSQVSVLYYMYTKISPYSRFSGTFTTTITDPVRDLFKHVHENHCIFSSITFEITRIDRESFCFVVNPWTVSIVIQFSRFLNPVSRMLDTQQHCGKNRTRQKETEHDHFSKFPKIEIRLQKYISNFFC